MKTFIDLLEQSPYGVETPYGGGYTAYVTPDEDHGGYHIAYCKGEMPPHATDHAATAEEAARKIAEVADLSSAHEIDTN